MSRRRNVIKLPGRYGDKIMKPMYDGIKFDSGAELKRYLQLSLMRTAGVIKNLVVHPRYPIVIGGVEVRIYSKRFHKTGRQMYYVGDFEYWDIENQCKVIEDVKMASGHRTDVYKIKKALMRAMGLEITEITNVD